MEVWIYGLAAVLVFSLLLIATFISRRQNNGGEVEAEVGQEEVRAPPRREAVMAGGVRRRAPRGRLQRAHQDSDEEDVDFDIEEGEEFEHVVVPDGKVGAKKMKKLQEKEEKRRAREAELQDRQDRKDRDKLQDEQRLKDDKRKALQEKEEEEAVKLRKEEEEAREHEEYLKLKATFEIEEEGMQDTGLDEDPESLLQSFINYIQDMKVIMLEDLAAHFKLKTQDCIDRIKTLQEEGRLSGVMDDRGKFIHITMEEYQAVAKFIKQRGRVSITELAEHSNKLINLNPDNQDTHTKLMTDVITT